MGLVARILMLFGCLAVLSTAAACSSPPVADFATSATTGPAPLEVRFTPSEESDDAAFTWDFGDGVSSTERAPTHTYEDAGAFTVRLTVTKGEESLSREAVVSVEPGAAGWVVVTPEDASLKTGDTVRFEAQAFDSLGNPVRGPAITWSADPGAGQISPDGTFTAGPELGTFPGGVTASFERLGATGSGGVDVSVIPGPVADVTIEPPVIDVAAAGRLRLNVTAKDAAGHVLQGVVTRWTALRDVDRIDDNGEFRAATTATEGEVDLARVIVLVDGSSAERVVRGSVRPGILDRLEVTPAEVTVPVGGEAKLEAKGFDRFNNEVKLDSIEWVLVNSDPGTVDDTGLFKAGTLAGDFTENHLVARGTTNRITASTSVPVVIQPGPAVAITLQPSMDSVPVGGGAPFVARIEDEFGNLHEETGVEWSASGGGTITTGGIFVAGFETGEFPDAVQARLPANAAGNAADLSATADVTVRERSSDMLAVEVTGPDGAGVILIDLRTAQSGPLSEEIAENDAVEAAPAWWPDGSRLAFASDVSGKLQIYEMDITTRAVRQLTDDPDGATMPAVSPDGQRLAYVAVSGETWQIYIADLPDLEGDGEITPVTREDAVRLTQDDTQRHLLPFWSPDGASIAFTTSDADGTVAAYHVVADGSSEPVRIGEGQEVVFGWTVEEDRLLIGSGLEDGGLALTTIGVDSSDPSRPLVLPFPVLLAALSPDNSEVVLIDAFFGRMWLVDSDGTGLRQALGSEFSPRRAAWRPVPILDEGR